VRFLEHKSDPQKYYAAFDVFLLTSAKIRTRWSAWKRRRWENRSFVLKKAAACRNLSSQDCGSSFPIWTLRGGGTDNLSFSKR